MPDNASDNAESNFLLRHGVSSFFSTDMDGEIISSPISHSCSMRYSPFKEANQLRDMSRCLVQKKSQKSVFLKISLPETLLSFLAVIKNHSL